MTDKVLVIGHARHGKDTFCEMLKERGLSFESSSEAALEEAIWPLLKGFYKSKKECFEDRVNHRALWFTLIRYYNTPNKSKLAEVILSKSDVYCGIRNLEEFEASKHLFKHIVWVGAENRKPLEGPDSFELDIDDCNYVVNNNGDLKYLERQSEKFMQHFYSNM